MIATKMIVSAFLLSPALLLFQPKQDPMDARFGARVQEYMADVNAPLDTTLVNELRSYGYAGVNWLGKLYQQAPNSYDDYMEQSHKLLLLDKVCGQKDAVFAKLFWHTNLEQAKAIAKEEKKMILSLCMLGDFTEDLSCANSRFFRIFLYSNDEVAELLRSRFVLHVQSVIDVPKITIEYPDGTKQVQTITGNSMHLAMTADGEIVDALPGLYGPDYFRKWLVRTGYSNPEVKMPDISVYLDNYAKELDSLAMLTENISFIDTTISKISSRLPVPISKAYLASIQSVRKSVIEAPLFTAMSPTAIMPVIEYTQNEKAVYEKLSKLGFMRENIDNDFPVGAKPIKVKKKYDAMELWNITIQVNDQLTVENIRNEVLYHHRVLEWLKDSNMRNNMQAFIEKSYRELFKTPLNDKKMGMYNPALFYGLTNDGF